MRSWLTSCVLLVLIAVAVVAEPIDPMILPMVLKEPKKGSTVVLILKPEGDPVPVIIASINLALALMAFRSKPCPTTALAVVSQALVLYKRIRALNWTMEVVNITLPSP